MIPAHLLNVAADLARTAGNEGGNIHPTYEQGNTAQAGSSVYYGRRYDDGNGNTEPPYGGDPGRWAPERLAEADERREHEHNVATLVHYMLARMEPTDRCLRPPGDIWTVEREEQAAQKRQYAFGKVDNEQ